MGRGKKIEAACFSEIGIMYSHGPYMDLIDLDPQPILGMGSDIH